MECRGMDITLRGGPTLNVGTMDKEKTAGHAGGGTKRDSGIQCRGMDITLRGGGADIECRGIDIER